MILSERTAAVVPSATVVLNSKVLELKRSGVEVIKMNIGEPDFNTPENICAAAKAAMDQGQTRYTAVPGTIELREAIAQKLHRDNGLSYDPSEICVTTGAKLALMETLMATVQKGDEVIIPTPCWVSYENMVRIAGATPVFVPTSTDPENRFALDVDAIRSAVTDRTRAVVINTPNNPTGAVYSEESLRQLVDLAIAHNFIVITDEVYEKLVYGGKTHCSAASFSEAAKACCVTVNGFSKSYAMTGWRLGYLAGPKELVKAVSKLQGHITSGTSSVSQAAGVEALTGPQDSILQMRQAFDRRRQLMQRMCNEIPHVSCREALGAFYLMPDLSWYFGKSVDGKVIANAQDIAAYLLEAAHIAVVPGDAFRAPDCIRLSYSNSMENIERGMKQMRQALERLN